MIWTRVFGLKATELLHTGAAEALPRNCSVWSRPNLLLSLQTGYCISHDTVAVCTHTVRRACSASRNTLFNLSVTALPVDLGFWLNKASSSRHLLWCSTPSPPRPTPGLLHWGAKSNVVSTHCHHPPFCQMPACHGNVNLKWKGSESSLQLPRFSTWLMGPPSSKWACLLARSFFRIQLKQAAQTLASHARACCHAICSFSGTRKCQKLQKQPGSSRPIWSLKRPR